MAGRIYGVEKSRKRRSSQSLQAEDAGDGAATASILRGGGRGLCFYRKKISRIGGLERSPRSSRKITDVPKQKNREMQKILIAALRFYQRTISPYLKCSCKFYPTCSEYAIQAIEKYGCIKGILKSTRRLLRCNPFSRGGIDFP